LSLLSLAGKRQDSHAADMQVLGYVSYLTYVVSSDGSEHNS